MFIFLVSLVLSASSCLQENGSEMDHVNVLVLVIDTVRADRLGAYGFARETSPNIDKLASEGVLFEEAISSAPRTWQSFTSILTGLYPLRHGVRFIFDDPLPSHVETLASHLAREGYRTAAFDAKDFLYLMTGGRAGFHEYIDARGRALEMPDEEVAEDLLSWVEKNRRRPFFAFVRFNGPHWPYRPKQEFHDMFGDDDGADHSFNEGHYGLTRTRGEGYKLVDAESYHQRIFDTDYTPEELDHMLLHYDACIRTIDETVGKIANWFRDNSLMDSVLLIVTSDHGESFGEHGYMQHGPRTDRGVLRVPLIIRFPKGLKTVRSGRRIAQLVRTVDILPTVLEAVGTQVPPGLDGVSLLPAVDDNIDLALTAYAESGREFVGVDPMRMLPGVAGKNRMFRDQRWKLTYRHDGTAPIYALYDLEADPNETTNVASHHTDVFRRMRSSFEQLLAADVSPDKVGKQLTSEQIERLRALGYVH
jgi:arylsulfatase A-like enzyme